MIPDHDRYFPAFRRESHQQKVMALLAVLVILLLHPSVSQSETSRELHPNGQVWFERDTDEQQLPHGTSQEYDEHGNLIAERNYEHGVLQGISRLYYPTGQVKTEWIYKNGLRDGISLGYYKSGKIKDRGYYKHDKLNGVVQFFFSDGTLKSTLNLKDDLPEGRAKTYYPDGSLEYLYQYRNGQLIRRKSFDREGNLIHDQEFPFRGIQP